MEDLLADAEGLTNVGKKRVRHELDLDSPDVKRLRDDLFDDSSNDLTIQDLDSVIKSFEDELSSTTTVVHVSDETQPDLGYLFEASDDELGLPPPPQTEETVTELVRDSSEVEKICRFENRCTGFGSFDLGDLLFEYSESCLDSGDMFSWLPE